MEEDIFDSLIKKDEDVLIIGDYAETTIAILPDEYVDVTSVPSTLLEDERTGARMDVYVRMIQIIFMVNALFAYLAVMIGAVPYFMLQYVPTPIYIMAGLWAVAGLAYVLMLTIRAQIFMFTWFFLMCMALGATCAVVQNEAPLQIAAAIFIQSITVIMYTAISKRGISTRTAVAVMTATGLMTWIVGIYAFVLQKDWASGGVVLAATVAFAAYAGAQIHYVTRYTLEKEKMLQAIVNFYGDPVTCWCKR